MGHDFFDAALGAETVGGVFLEQLRDKVLALFAHLDLVAGGIGEIDWLLLYQLVHLQIVAISGVEGREADDHLVGQDTKSPPVNGEGVALLVEDLGGKILWGAAEGEGLGVIVEDLGQTEIGQTDIAVFIHKNVLGFKISIDNVLFMQMSDGNSDLCGIETGSILCETGGCPQMHEQFTASHESHNEENLRLCLEDVMHANQEGMIGLHQNLFLELRGLHLIVVENDVLPQRFHRINFSSVFFLDEEDLSEAASADDLLNSEVLEGHLFVALLGVEGL